MNPIDQRKNAIETLTKIGDNRNQAYYGFLKNILLMASSLIGILISLHKEKCDTDFSRLVFCLTLIFCMIGIIFLTICLSYEYKIHESLYNNANEVYKEMVRTNNYSIKEIRTNNKSKIFNIFENIGFLSLVISLLLLLLYGMSIA